MTIGSEQVSASVNGVTEFIKSLLAVPTPGMVVPPPPPPPPPPLVDSMVIEAVQEPALDEARMVAWPVNASELKVICASPLALVVAVAEERFP